MASAATRTEQPPAFVPGLELARAFFKEAVEPILDEYFPDLRYAAGLVGSGSEVLGYDTAMSTDHDWGPRVMLFVAEDEDESRSILQDVLSERLPHWFRGFSTNFGAPSESEGDVGTRLRVPLAKRTAKVNHRVEIFTLENFTRQYLGVERGVSPLKLTPGEWLSLPQQKLLSLTSKGAVFRDDLGTLTALRSSLAYYPRDVWLYMLAAGWARVAQEEHLAPRAGFVGDELGSAVLAGRLVKSIMDLCFLMERRYAPYAKWFGTAFAELACAAEMTPHLRKAQAGLTYRDREAGFVAAFTVLNRMHASLEVATTTIIEPAVCQFHARPFTVSDGWRYQLALTALIQDDAVLAIARRTSAGSLDQFSDNTDLKESAEARAKLLALYE